ncbi:MAG TPA: hypothetical protein VJC00_01445 [Candidatus Nanoarchaeia archaeon]|nr:hypothetical protein [Candidatus Nanoarchaeia archaeon]
MKLHRNLLNLIIGIVCIVVGVIISLDFIIKFALAALGILLIIIGMSFLTRKW